ncbi:hypothetical protein C8R44DRAFT_882719 [Mycena epipterygia]|nr:hypothetical protein C8R44DRAFT_882719 [Mycena epipterygia]
MHQFSSYSTHTFNLLTGHRPKCSAVHRWPSESSLERVNSLPSSLQYTCPFCHIISSRATCFRYQGPRIQDTDACYVCFLGSSRDVIGSRPFLHSYLGSRAPSLNHVCDNASADTDLALALFEDQLPGMALDVLRLDGLNWRSSSSLTPPNRPSPLRSYQYFWNLLSPPLPRNSYSKSTLTRAS